MKKLIFVLQLLIFLSISALSQTELFGQLTDSETKEPVMFANVSIYQKGLFVTGAQTDFDGNYCMLLNPGIYEIRISYVGYQTKRIHNLLLLPDSKKELIITLKADVNITSVGSGCGYWVPLMQKDNTTQGRTFTREDIRHIRR